MSDREKRYERLSKKYPFFYLEDWKVLAIHEHGEKISVDFAFYLLNGEFSGKGTFEFPKSDKKKWKKLVGKKILVQAGVYDQHGQPTINIIEG